MSSKTFISALRASIHLGRCWSHLPRMYRVNNPEHLLQSFQQIFHVGGVEVVRCCLGAPGHVLVNLHQGNSRSRKSGIIVSSSTSNRNPEVSFSLSSMALLIKNSSSPASGTWKPSSSNLVISSTLSFFHDSNGVGG